MGDFHGNINDLLYFEKVLWHIGPGLTPSSLLFLGDYVDRGAFSFEVIAYLFSYKLQSPNKVNLLRGNHEIREVQKMFTFYKECCLKFGEKLGNEVWIASNNAFDTMPIAATIDGKVRYVTLNRCYHKRNATLC
uniref:Serine/threonine-protein phosphatase PP2A-1 catalytic subunit-like isoform X1 n=1 Tax=Diabrotica virgifera virgifera TaxID=50390 RepID=A0A6P7HAR5_DIAVI